MGQASFELDIEIKQSPTVVSEFLRDLRNFLPLHPLIQSIREVEPSRDMPRAQRYEVVDRIPIGPTSFRVTYVAAIEQVDESEIHGYAWQNPGVRLHTVYRIERIPTGTHVYESVSIDAPWFLVRYVARKARGAHEETLLKLQTVLEAKSERGGSSG